MCIVYDINNNNTHIAAIAPLPLCIILCYVIGKRAQLASLIAWSLNCALLYISIIIISHWH